MAEFFLKNSCFEISEKVFRQISRAAIATKFRPPYACIFMEETESSFIKTQQLQRFIWLRYIDDIFFTCAHSEEQLSYFSKISTNFIRT